MARRPVTATDRLERHAPRAALLVVVAGFAIRLMGIGTYWVNADEGIYYSTLTAPSFEAFWTEVLANAHPPAFYLLLRGLGYLTWDFIWLRAPSVLFGAVAIWVFWRVGRRLGGAGLPGIATGLATALLLTLNPNAIVLSQVSRPYTLLVLLLSAALLSLLRYQAEGDGRWLIAYAVFLALAELTHYSAALGLAVFSVLIVHDLVTGRLRGRAAIRALSAHAVPALVFGALYLLHLRPALESELMAQALGPGGWLTGWLVDSPGAAWDNLVAYQDFHLSTTFRVRTVILLLAAVALSAASRDRTVSVLAASALGVGILVSALGLYPFGESRHNAWLTVFTTPALGWLAGRLTTGARVPAVAAASAALLLFAFGAPLETALGPPPRPSVAFQTSQPGQGATRTEEPHPLEEHLISIEELAPLIVQRMDPEGEPETIVMTEQTYNVLMPLYAGDRDHLAFSADSTLFSLDYGTREIVVFRTWDWAGVEDLARRVQRIAGAHPAIEWEGESTLLLVVGGWGSTILPHMVRLTGEGVIREMTVAPGGDASGRFVVRIAAAVVDPEALADAYGPSSKEGPDPSR